MACRSGLVKIAQEHDSQIQEIMREMQKWRKTVKVLKKYEIKLYIVAIQRIFWYYS